MYGGVEGAKRLQWGAVQELHRAEWVSESWTPTDLAYVDINTPGHPHPPTIILPLQHDSHQSHIYRVFQFQITMSMTASYRKPSYSIVLPEDTALLIGLFAICGSSQLPRYSCHSHRLGGKRV